MHAVYPKPLSCGEICRREIGDNKRAIGSERRQWLVLERTIRCLLGWFLFIRIESRVTKVVVYVVFIFVVKIFIFAVK